MTIPLCGRCHGRAHHDDRNMAPGRLVRDTMEAKRRSGLCMGTLPYGFSLDENGPRSRKGRPVRLVENPEQQEVIKRMWAEWESGKSILSIAAGLNADGVPPRGGSVRWNDKSVGRVLNRVARERADAALAPPRPEQAFTPTGLPPDGDGPVIAR